MIKRDFTRSQSRSYAGPRLRNPFFAHGPHRLWRVAIAGACIVVPIALAVISLYAPFMQYREVQVAGLTTLSDQDVRRAAEAQLERRTALIIPGTHIFFGRTQAVASYLNATYSFDEVVISRKGRALHVVAKERITEIAWQTGEKTYLIDLQGNVVREASPEAASLIAARLGQLEETPFAPGIQPTMPILVDNAANEAIVGASILSKNVIGNVLLLDEMLRVRSLLPVGYYFDTPTTPWLTVHVSGGPQFLFDVQGGEPVSSIAYLDVYLAEHANQLPEVTYIDLRFENHIYTKPR